MRIDIERLSAVLPATELVEVLKNEIARLRLTDAERSLLAMLADHLQTHQIMPYEAATLRGMLERLK